MESLNYDRYLVFMVQYGLVAQLVRAPPCHGGGRGFEPHPGRYTGCDDETCAAACVLLLTSYCVMDGFPSGQRGQTVNLLSTTSVVRIHPHPFWDLSSAGRASALQAEGHRFEPCRSHFSIAG